MTEPEFNDANLDDLFAAARRSQVSPSSDLMARILADANANIARPVTFAPKPVPFWWSWMPSFAAFGGLATAAVAGLWIGANPALISEDLAVILGVSSVQAEDGYWATDASGGFLTEMVDG